MHDTLFYGAPFYYTQKALKRPVLWYLLRCVRHARSVSCREFRIPVAETHALRALLDGLQMPLEHLLEDGLASRLDDISMARHNRFEIPLRNLAHTLVETTAVSRRDGIPQESLLPLRIALCRVDSIHYLRQDPARRTNSSPRVLFVRRQIEHQVRLNQCLRRPMTEHQFFIRMRIHKLHIKLPIELVIHTQLLLLRLLE